MDSIRKVYQRAVTVPLNNVEQIWSEYNHWEQNLNKLTVSLLPPTAPLTRDDPVVVGGFVHFANSLRLLAHTMPALVDPSAVTLPCAVCPRDPSTYCVSLVTGQEIRR
jgi:hypothetical protein